MFKLFSELDLFSALVTFLACLLWNLAYGILVGVAVQLVFILYSIARPKVDIEEKKVLIGIHRFENFQIWLLEFMLTYFLLWRKSSFCTKSHWIITIWTYKHRLWKLLLIYKRNNSEFIFSKLKPIWIKFQSIQTERNWIYNDHFYL